MSPCSSLGYGFVGNGLSLVVLQQPGHAGGQGRAGGDTAAAPLERNLSSSRGTEPKSALPEPLSFESAAALGELEMVVTLPW